MLCGDEGSILFFLKEEGDMKLKYALVWPVCLFLAVACFKSKGGVQVTLQIITDDAIETFLDESILRMKELLERDNIAVGSLKRGQPGQFLIEEYKAEDYGKIRDMLFENYDDWNLSLTDRTASLGLKTEASRLIRSEALDQTLAVLRNRLKRVGESHARLERLSGDRIRLELQGSEAETDRVLGLLKIRAVLEWKLVQAGPSADEVSLLKDYGGQVPGDMQVLRAVSNGMESGCYLVHRVAYVTGKDIRSVRLERDQRDNPAVGFELKPQGAQRFGRLTGENIGRQVAIILDGQVQSAPIVQSRIYDRGIIQGNFTLEEVNDLILMLKSGALPAGIKVIEIKKL
jgi:preprotein translocase subunit SecD